MTLPSLSRARASPLHGEPSPEWPKDDDTPDDLPAVLAGRGFELVDAHGLTDREKRAWRPRQRGEWQKMPRAFLHFTAGLLVQSPTGRVACPFKRSAAECAVQAAEARAIAGELRRLITRGGPLELGRTAGRRTWQRLETTATVLDELAEWNEELVELILDGQDWWDARLRRLRKNPIAELVREAERAETSHRYVPAAYPRPHEHKDSAAVGDSLSQETR